MPRAVLAAGCAGTLAFAVPAAAHAQTAATSWAGYAAHGATYTSVTAAWTQPKMTCTGSGQSYAAFWVGLDGYSSDTVEQAGTDAECASGKAEYFAWYELYPAYPVTLTTPVSPGDAMTATVSATTAGVFTITVKDTTAGWTYSGKHNAAGAARASAEVVLEVPAASGTGGGSVTFTGANVDGAALGAANPTELGSDGVTCGPLLVGGTTFTCTWS